MDEMTYRQISCYATPNPTDGSHVDEIEQSILEHGWRGAPILVDSIQGICITGSHRMAALARLAGQGRHGIGDMKVALDVHGIVQDWWDKQDPELLDCVEFPYDSLGSVFAGTEVEQYKDEIAEW
ncbi:MULTISPECIES: ParB N-terminal domain-containing protein [Bifidobacterium]|uniref:ParB N-terminal domain-containing protein n=1 Tax=Bifidobacterium TaxID=1678 RepID=UPI0018DB6CF3|nr:MULTISPECIES: ParB N-terminal domain-containing protein [Bifidobacterium]MBH9981109.1 ParB N-terminal domain-containing protein [Bifidobacterium asteroides]MBI0100375.1 ParB N-terminal domain-containing protein [Bifidobacterium sp. W8114]